MPKEKFVKLVQSIIDQTVEIDAETPWQSVEPGWWLDMMQLQRFAYDIRDKHKEGSEA